MRRRRIRPFPAHRSDTAPEDLTMTTQHAAPAGGAQEIAQLRMTIGGRSVDAVDGRTFEIVNPATGRVIATAPLGGEEDVDRAVVAAQGAFDDPKGWRTWAASKRGRTIARFAALLQDHTEK